VAQENLKEFQEGLARRLRDASEVESSARLGLESGGQRYLLRLEEAGEVLPLPALYPVPLTRSWFLGLTNVRGNLVAVVDLAGFAGGAATAQGAGARLVLFAERFGARSSLLAARMLGLKNLAAFEPCDRGTAPPWVRACYTEKNASSVVWRELDMGGLIANESFLQVCR
jgi:twitching motility protein PilI